MRKISIVTIILSSFILASCNLDGNNEVFDKRQECGKYKDKITKEIQDTYDRYGELKEIFYSSNRKSCIYVVQNGSINTRVVDYLTAETLFDTLNQYCGLVDGKIEFGKTKDVEPFNKIFKEYEFKPNEIIGTDKCEDKIKEKFERGIKILKGE